MRVVAKGKKKEKNAPRDKEGSVSAQIIVHLVLIQREKNATTERPVMSALQSDSLQVPKPKRTLGSKETSPRSRKEGEREKRQRKAEMER